MKKRFLAALLSACLAFTPCAGGYVPAWGAQQDAVQTDRKQSILEVEVVSTQLFPYEGDVTVEISDGTGRPDQKQLAVTKDVSATAKFEVTPGDYTVRIRAEKFADYTQQIRTEAGWIHKIKVGSSRIQNGDGARTGWLRCGDVDGDGDIDEQDAETLLDAIRTGNSSANCDLNGDGKTDLEDLSCLVQGKDDVQEIGRASCRERVCLNV